MLKQKEKPIEDKIRFNVGNYQFLCGFAHLYDWQGKIISGNTNFCLWMWNGHYYHIARQHLSGEEEARKVAENPKELLKAY